MESSPETDPSTYFGFTDLHGFKDFVVYVFACAPDLFPYDDWRQADEQMNLGRAFIGLHFGLDISAREKGELPIFSKCRELVDEAYAMYCAGHNHSGQLKLEEVSSLLKRIPSQ